MLLFTLHDLPNAIITRNNDLVHKSDCVNVKNPYFVFLVICKETKSVKKATQQGDTLA